MQSLMRAPGIDCLNSGNQKGKILQKSVEGRSCAPFTGRSALALGTVMGSAPGNQNSTNRRLAAQAGQAGAKVDAVLELKEPPLAIGVNVIGDRRAAESNGVRQDFAQRQPQAVKLGAGDAVGTPPRANAGMKEAFVRVDVAHAGQQRLVQQSCLDAQTPPAKKCGKFVRTDGERFVAWRAECSTATEIAELKPAKPPRIDES